MMKTLLKTPGRFFSRRYILPDLSQHEKKVHSQFGEDGIIAAIFDAIPPRSRFFVEFGIGPHWLDTEYAGGLEGNCVLLRKQGWKGVFFDAGSHPPEYDVVQEFITADTVNDVFARHGVPDTVDIVSIDIDGQDWWVWNALRYRPALIVVEYNGHKGPDEAVTVPFDPDFRWDGTDHYGASLRALDLLAQRKGYTLVFANGVNAFFVRTDRLSAPEGYRFEELYRPAQNHDKDPQERAFVVIR